MAPYTYPRPSGVYEIPSSQLDLRPDADIDHALLHPPSVTSEKNVWFFWHQGYASMHGYTQRITRAWHRRFSKAGWTIRVLDRVPGSPLNIEKFLDIHDPDTFPQAFRESRISGTYAAQHTSDLVRFPLLLKYGGVYADVGMIQIGDLDALWNATLGDESGPWEVLSYNPAEEKERWITNYFMAARKQSPFFLRCQKLLLKLWEGKSDTNGMHKSPLLEGAPLLDNKIAFIDDDGTFYDEAASAALLSDYIIQGQVLCMVMNLLDEEGGWNGPKYCAEHMYCIDFMVGSQHINTLTNWDGERAFYLMSLHLPREGDAESEDQKQAREIVEQCLAMSFGFKLAHGIILKMMGPTLGSLWRQNVGSDDVEGTYAHWLRHGTVYWCPDELPRRLEFKQLDPLRTGALLGREVR